MRRRQVSITIEPELWERVKARARGEGRSTSNLVEWLLRVAMEERETEEHDEGEAEAT